MIRVQEDDFDVGTELARLTTGRTDVGGIATFLGFVRGHGQADMSPLVTMTLEHYPGMTERQLAAIALEARRRWRLCDLLIVHRIGQLMPGDKIVLVATSAKHRAAAFECCQFLIDWLKTRAPFWKLEKTTYSSTWVKPRTRDTAATTRWDNNG